MTRRSRWIACAGPFLFPWGEAGSRRVYGLVASLAAAGYDVVVAGGGPEPRTMTPLPGVDGPGSVSHIGLAEKPPPEAGPLGSSIQTLLRWGQRTVRWLDAQPTKPSHVLVHGGQAQYMFHLQRWCRRNNVPLIVDVVDWFNGRYVRGGYLGPLHASMKLAMHYYYPRCDGVIAISSYLEAHYRRAGMPILRVPPTLDVKNLTVDARPTVDDSSPSRSSMPVTRTETRKISWAPSSKRWVASSATARASSCRSTARRWVRYATCSMADRCRTGCAAWVVYRRPRWRAPCRAPTSACSSAGRSGRRTQASRRSSARAWPAVPR